MPSTQYDLMDDLHLPDSLLRYYFTYNEYPQGLNCVFQYSYPFTQQYPIAYYLKNKV